MSNRTPNDWLKLDGTSHGPSAWAVGAVRWHGWRPPFINYEAWQRGHDLIFLLERKGDLMLVPLALTGQALASGQVQGKNGVGDVLSVLMDLVKEEWQVLGRLHTQFVGTEVEGEFWRETLRHLGFRI